MKDFKTVPPKQKYMTIEEIYKAYGSRGVVAYSCKETDSVPEGGFVIAVQDKPGTVSASLKEYRRQFNLKYPSKAPIYYIRVEVTDGDQHIAITFDNGKKEQKAVQKITVRKTEAELMIESIPDELIAMALSTALNMPD